MSVPSKTSRGGVGFEKEREKNEKGERKLQQESKKMGRTVRVVSTLR